MSIPRPWVALALLLVSLAFAAGCGAARDSSDMPQAELAAEIQAGQAPLVLDVRTPEEYASGHVPGALNIAIDELKEREGEIDARRGQPVVVYCERGPRAVRAAKVLESAGFTSVRLLAGHMAGWRSADLPIE